MDNANSTEKVWLTGVPEETNRMYGIISGYWASQIAGTLARLGIPDRLSAGPLNAVDLAAELDCDPGAVSSLLRAAASIDILSGGPEGTFSLTPLGSTLRSEVPGSLRGMAATLTAPCHWEPWGQLEQVVRTGKESTETALGADFFGYLGQHQDQLKDFLAAMDDVSRLIETEAVRVLDFPDGAHLVDVGGGSGMMLAALLKKNPSLSGTVLELPQVVPAARQLIEDRGLSARCEVVEGDFFQAVPEADAYLLKLILHDWNDERATAILATCARSLRPGGRITVIDTVVPDDSIFPLPAMLDLHMRTILGGRERTAAEHEKIWTAAGLRLEQITNTSSSAPILQGTLA